MDLAITDGVNSSEAASLGGLFFCASVAKHDLQVAHLRRKFFAHGQSDTATGREPHRLFSRFLVLTSRFSSLQK